MRSEPVDPDIDLSIAGQTGEWFTRRMTLPVIAVGGMAGACARYGLELAFPVSGGGVPWATFVTNVSGCLVLGVLMVIVQEIAIAHPLVRPFVGVGVIGGFTTFSTYTVQVRNLVVSPHALTGVVYLFGTVVAGLAAVALGLTLTRLVARRTWRRPGSLTAQPGEVR